MGILHMHHVKITFCKSCHSVHLVSKLDRKLEVFFFSSCPVKQRLNTQDIMCIIFHFKLHREETIPVQNLKEKKIHPNNCVFHINLYIKSVSVNAGYLSPCQTLPLSSTFLFLPFFLFPNKKYNYRDIQGSIVTFHR